MMDLASIFRQSLDLWQNPPYTELTPEAFLDCANRILTEYGLDLELTADAAFATTKSDPFTFGSTTAREYSLEADIDDLSRIIRVESRLATSTNEDDWQEESIASYDDWNEVSERSDKDFVSFFGTPPALTMVVARDVSTLEFRIIYRQLRAKITAATDPIDFPDIFEPLFVYAIALEAGEIIDNQSLEFLKKKSDKMPYLAGRRDEAEKRIDKWRRSQRGSSSTTRRPFNDRNEGVQTGRRRFSVTY